MRAAKNIYYKNYFDRNKKNLKMVWQGIRLALNNKTKSMDPPQVILHNNKNINDPVEVSNAFNNYFGCIAEKTKSKLFLLTKAILTFF